MYNICFSSDNNYAPHLAVTIASILKSNPNNDLHFYVLDGGINEINKKKLLALKTLKNFEIDFITIDVQEFQHCIVPKKSHFTKNMYYRFKIPSIFKHLNKILYLDCDLVVLKDLKHLFERELGDAWLGMVPDYFSKELVVERAITGRPYYNSGVMMFNIPLCNKANLEKKLFDFVKILKCSKYGDQDCINEVAGNYVLSLEKEWNTQYHPFVVGQDKEIIASMNNVSILHYTSKFKPWNSPYHQLNNYYYHYLQYTPYKGAYMKHLFNRFKFFVFRYTKQEGCKEWKIFGLPIIKKTRKKDYSRKLFFCGIPIWITPADKWRIKYDELIAENMLYKKDFDAIKEQLDLLNGMKLAKRKK